MNPLTWFTIVIEWHVKMLIYKVFGRTQFGFCQQQMLGLQLYNTRWYYHLATVFIRFSLSECIPWNLSSLNWFSLSYTEISTLTLEYVSQNLENNLSPGKVSKACVAPPTVTLRLLFKLHGIPFIFGEADRHVLVAPFWVIKQVHRCMDKNPSPSGRVCMFLRMLEAAI